MGLISRVSSRTYRYMDEPPPPAYAPKDPVPSSTASYPTQSYPTQSYPTQPGQPPPPPPGVVHVQPTAGTPLNPTRIAPRFTHELCDCCSPDCGICCQAWCVPCVPYGKTAEALGQGSCEHYGGAMACVYCS